MKALIWIVIGLVVIGGLVWLVSTDTETSDINGKIDALSDSGRALTTDTAVFEEIEDAIDLIE